MTPDVRGRSRRSFRWTALRDYLRGALWFLPTLAVAVSLAAGFGLSQLHPGEDSLLGRLAYQGDADDARQLLIVVAATMITVTGLVFSVTIVALQIASAQFSPRLLRNFLRDRGTQLVLATFVSTFAYSFAGLHTVGTPTTSGEFVPRVAISGSMVLALASLGMLVYFVHHMAHSIQVDHIMRDVERRTFEVIDESEADPAALEPGSLPLPIPPARSVTLPAHRSGYVQSVDVDRLLEVATERDLVVVLGRRVGEHLVAGSPLALVWRPGERDPAPDPVALGHDLHAAVRIGIERTMEQDVRFGLRQLVDVALRAISPAVNDPYTAVQAIQHLSALVSTLAERRLAHRVVHDAAGVVRVGVPVPGFADYLDLACDQIRRSGAREPAVVLGLLRLLATAASGAPTAERREAISAELELLVEDAERETVQEHDLAAVREEADRARALIRSAAAEPAAGRR